MARLVAEQQAPPLVLTHSPVSSPRPSRWRVWPERVALILLGPLVFFSVTEVSLRLLGYGYSATFWLKESATNYITNERFVWQFYSVDTRLKPYLYRLAAKKPPGGIRICILGESAAMGTPEPAFNFGRMLEAQLRRAYPGKRVEVVNGAVRAIDSHIVRLIARECASHQVDLFVAYTGNNEMIGAHGPEPNSPRWGQSLFLIRSSQWARSSRLGQLIVALASGKLDTAEPAMGADMAYFRRRCLPADDGRRKTTVANFQANLEGILDAAARAGARLILCTVPSNLIDCPPFASLHRPDLADSDRARWDHEYAEGARLESAGQLEEAIRRYSAAASLDDHYAELHFRLGRCYLAAGDTNQASKHYSQALDWDALQFRADGSINAVIRRVAAAGQARGTRLVDLVQALVQGGIPGRKFFCDNVHLTFAGNDAVARALYGTVVDALELEPKRRPAAPLLSPQECAEVIGYTASDELGAIASTVKLTARPPFLDQLDHARRQAAAESDLRDRVAAFTARDAEACLAAYQAATRREPNYWPLRFRIATVSQQLGRYPEAAEQFRRLVEEYPQDTTFRLSLASCLLRTGDTSGALAQLERALRLNPADKETHRILERIGAGRPK